MKQFLIQAPDWGLLKQQKQTLLNLIAELEKAERQTELDCYWSFLMGTETAYPLTHTIASSEDLQGLLNFIDSIQDNAIEAGIWTENEIFPPTTFEATIKFLDDESTQDVTFAIGMHDGEWDDEHIFYWIEDEAEIENFKKPGAQDFIITKIF